MLTDLSYKIKLLVKSGDNNDSTVSEDGKELTWNLRYSKVNEVNFSFSLGNDLLIVIIVFVGIALIGGLVVFIVFSKNKKKFDNNLSSMQGFATPGQFNNNVNNNNDNDNNDNKLGV